MSFLLASASSNLISRLRHQDGSPAPPLLAYLAALRAVELELRFVEDINQTRLQGLHLELESRVEYANKNVQDNVLIKAILGWMKDAVRGVLTATPTDRLMTVKGGLVEQFDVAGLARRIIRCRQFFIVLQPGNPTMLVFYKHEMQHTSSVYPTIVFQGRRRIQPNITEPVRGFIFGFTAFTHVWTTRAQIPMTPYQIMR